MFIPKGICSNRSHIQLMTLDKLDHAGVTKLRSAIHMLPARSVYPDQYLRNKPISAMSPSFLLSSAVFDNLLVNKYVCFHFSRAYMHRMLLQPCLTWNAKSNFLFVSLIYCIDLAACKYRTAWLCGPRSSFFQLSGSPSKSLATPELHSVKTRSLAGVPE